MLDLQPSLMGTHLTLRPLSAQDLAGVPGYGP
jgi:hypothetical protein